MVLPIILRQWFYKAQTHAIDHMYVRIRKIECVQGWRTYAILEHILFYEYNIR